MVRLLALMLYGWFVMIISGVSMYYAPKTAILVGIMVAIVGWLIWRYGEK